MKRFYITTEELQTRTIFSDEFNHIKNVMRMKEGDKFVAFSGDEKDYVCQINNIKKNLLTFDILEEKINSKNPQIEIHLYQALAKGEKMELVAQKCTEIGISTFIPLFVNNCDVKPNTTKTNRLEKIVIGACKQCGRSKLPEIKPIVKLSDCLNTLKSYDLVLFANETENSTRIFDVLNKNKTAKSVAIIIGPEGGFTPDEIAALSAVSKSVSLGSRILRTETASIYLTSIINDFYRN